MLVLLLLAGPVLLVRNFIIRAQEGSQLVATGHPTDDGLVRLSDGTVTFVQSPTLARKVSRWLELDTDADPAFQIADANFVSNSADLNTRGLAHVRQVAQILNTDTEVRAQVLAVADNRHPDDAQVEQSRADTIRSELIRQHVSSAKVISGSRAALEAGEYDLIGEPGQESHLFIVITK